MKREAAVKKSESGYVVYIPARRGGRPIFQSADGSETYTWEGEDMVPITPRLGRATNRWEPVERDSTAHNAIYAAANGEVAAGDRGEDHQDGLTLMLQRADTYNGGISAAVANMASLQYNDVRFRQSLDALIEHASALRSML